MLGTTLVGSVNPEVVIAYVKPDTTIDYVDPSVGIFLDYDSKNKEFLGANGETLTLSDAFSRVVVYSRAFTDSIEVIDTPDIGQIHKEYPDHSVSIGDELAIQFNLSLTDSISSSETFAWTIGKNLTESISTGDTPTIGDIHRVSPTDGISVSDAVTYLHDGMLNTNMLNTRLISVGSLTVDADDVVLTHTEG
jgi:hypothetical protein